MKKFVSVLLSLLLIATVVVLASCNVNPIDKASKTADNYTIVASYDEQSHVLSATQTVEYSNRSENSLTCVKFHIYANQYRQDAATPIVPATYRTRAYVNGDSYGDITFDNVKVDGTAVAYAIEGQDLDILSVPTNELFPNQKATIEMTYQIQLANVAHRLGYTDNTVNLGNFYPVLARIENGNYVCSPYYNIGDPFVHDVANFNVKLTLPDNYLVASSGELVEATQTDGLATYSYKANALRDFAMVLSDKYQKLTQTVGNTQVNYYYYNDVDAEASLNTAAGMLAYLSKTAGEYPYPTYTVAETEFCYGGMEYGSFAMVTSGSQAYQEAIAHETAHQWFYGLVGSDQINNAWMDEGLADFVTYLYLDKAGVTPLENSIKSITKTYVSYVDVLNHYYDHVDTSFKSLDNYKNDNEYVVFTYVKGSLLFGTLYEVMGESRFIKALQNYVDSCACSIAAPSAIIDSFVAVGGSEIGKIFTDFIEGKEIVSQIVA